MTVDTERKIVSALSAFVTHIRRGDPVGVHECAKLLADADSALEAAARDGWPATAAEHG